MDLPIQKDFGLEIQRVKLKLMGFEMERRSETLKEIPKETH